MSVSRLLIIIVCLSGGCTPFDVITGASGAYGLYKNYQLEKEIESLKDELRRIKRSTSIRRRPMPSSIRMYSRTQNGRHRPHDQKI